jgi:hypothetical protein
VAVTRLWKSQPGGRAAVRSVKKWTRTNSKQNYSTPAVLLRLIPLALPPLTNDGVHAPVSYVLFDRFIQWRHPRPK